jgi:hypothetical protein
MTSRKVGLYKSVFAVIKKKCPKFEPRQIMADFEPSMRKAILASFPDTKLFGCR